MKYEKCITCPELGKSCDGPNFLTMEPKELGLWCNQKRALMPGMTMDKIAAVTDISKSAVSNFLNGKHEDFRIDTIRPIIKLITAGKWDDNACGNLSNSEKAHYELELRLRDEKISHLEKEATQFDAQINYKNRVIGRLSVGIVAAFVVSLTCLIVALN